MLAAAAPDVDAVEVDAEEDVEVLVAEELEVLVVDAEVDPADVPLVAVVEDEEELEVDEDDAVEDVDALVAEVVEEVPEDVLVVEPPDVELPDGSSQAMVPGAPPP